MSAGPLKSDFMSWVFAGPIDNDETKLQFSLQNACKDIGYFADFADDAGIDATVAKAAHAQITQVVEKGAGEEPIPALHRLM
jgi:3-hydroxyisobutyrate dehydrogenase-like beta-hydroxyacid dehydrogenase